MEDDSNFFNWFGDEGLGPIDPNDGSMREVGDFVDAQPAEADAPNSNPHPVARENNSDYDWGFRDGGPGPRHHDDDFRREVVDFAANAQPAQREAPNANSNPVATENNPNFNWAIGDGTLGLMDPDDEFTQNALDFVNSRPAEPDAPSSSSNPVAAGNNSDFDWAFGYEGLESTGSGNDFMRLDFAQNSITNPVAMENISNANLAPANQDDGPTGLDDPAMQDVMDYLDSLPTNPVAPNQNSNSIAAVGPSHSSQTQYSGHQQQTEFDATIWGSSRTTDLRQNLPRLDTALATNPDARNWNATPFTGLIPKSNATLSTGLTPPSLTGLTSNLSASISTGLTSPPLTGLTSYSYTPLSTGLTPPPSTGLVSNTNAYISAGLTPPLDSVQSQGTDFPWSGRIGEDLVFPNFSNTSKRKRLDPLSLFVSGEASNFGKQLGADKSKKSKKSKGSPAVRGNWPKKPQEAAEKCDSCRKGPYSCNLNYPTLLANHPCSSCAKFRRNCISDDTEAAEAAKDRPSPVVVGDASSSSKAPDVDRSRKPAEFEPESAPKRARRPSWHQHPSEKCDTCRKGTTSCNMNDPTPLANYPCSSCVVSGRTCKYETNHLANLHLVKVCSSTEPPCICSTGSSCCLNWNCLTTFEQALKLNRAFLRGERCTAPYRLEHTNDISALFIRSLLDLHDFGILTTNFQLGGRHRSQGIFFANDDDDDDCWDWNVHQELPEGGSSGSRLEMDLLYEIQWKPYLTFFMPTQHPKMMATRLDIFQSMLLKRRDVQAVIVDFHEEDSNYTYRSRVTAGAASSSGCTVWATRHRYAADIVELERKRWSCLSSIKIPRPDRKEDENYYVFSVWKKYNVKAILDTLPVRITVLGEWGEELFAPVIAIRECLQQAGLGRAFKDDNSEVVLKV